MRACCSLPGLIVLAALPAAAMAQGALPAPVDAAIASVEARAEPEQRWAFTTTVTMPEASLTARFDPSRPQGARWKVLAPADEDALTGEQEEILEALRADPNADRRVMVGHAGEDYGLRLYVARELAEDGPGAEGYYRFAPRDDVGLNFPPVDGAPAMPDEANGQLVLAGGMPVRVRLFADGPFKPNPAARVDVLDIFWDFGEVEPGGPIGIVRASTRIQGRALFRGFSTDNATVNADFRRVSAP